MNPWYIAIIELFIFNVLIIFFIVFLVSLIKAKKHKKPIRNKSVLLSLDIVFFVFSVIFVLSHSTYYKYNDWIIPNSSINTVMSKYGAFDVGTIQEGRSGKSGYYIYTDNGPIMPDHMKHYYWMYFNEAGTVYKVEDGISPGG